MSKIVASRMKDVKARRSWQVVENACLDGSHYEKVFRGDNVAECAVVKNLKLTTGEILRAKAMSSSVGRFNEEQQAKPARL